MIATRYKFVISSPERVAVLFWTAYANTPFFSRNSPPGCEQRGDELSHVMILLVFATVMGVKCSLQIHLASVMCLMTLAETLVSPQ